MRILLGILTVALAGLPYAAIADGDAESELEVPRPIEAEIDFEDIGAGMIRVTGEAEGLTPGDTYVSLVYDVGSEAEGPDACEPTIFDPLDPNNILDTMFLGFWNVDGDGNGTLGPLVNPTPLSLIGTVSIRNVAIFDDQGFGGFGPHAVLVCGEVDGDDDDDDDDD